MRASDTISGVILILFAAAMIALTLNFPAFPGQKYGPSLFPRLLGTGLILCGAILIWRDRRQETRQPWLVVEPWVRDPQRRLSFVIVLGSIVFYILTAETVGFIPVAFLILAGLFVWFGVRWVVAIPVAIGMTLLIHYFFANLMRVPLPRGWLDPIL